MKTCISIVGSFIASALLFGGVARAEEQKSPFYEGKTIQIIVGFAPGGGFDVWSRLVARHLNRHIPGKPTIIVQNMPGAGSLIAANRVYAMQPADGLTIVNFHGSQLLEAVIGAPSVKFDPQKFLSIGSPERGALPQVVYVRPEVAMSLEQLLKARQPVRLGGTAVGDPIFVIAKYLEVVGANIRVVSGYGGSNPVFQAIEQKEVDGLALAQPVAEPVFKRFLDEKIVVPLLKMGPDTPGFTSLKVPNYPDLVNRLRLTEEQEALGKFLINALALFRMYSLPPGTPHDRVLILRNALEQTLQDRQFLEEAAKARFVPALLASSEIENLVASLTSTPSNVKELYKRLFSTK